MLITQNIPEHHGLVPAVVAHYADFKTLSTVVALNNYLEICWNSIEFGFRLRKRTLVFN